jgi:hypothetical protein
LTEIFTYKPRVLEELARHGLKPLPATPPQQLRDAVRDLYKYEIRRLRTEVLARRIRRPDYAGHVIALRRRYPILSLPVELWTESMNPVLPPSPPASRSDHD